MEEKKGQKFYSQGAKLTIILLQMICVVLFGIFVVLAGYLIDSSGNIDDLIAGNSYEDSTKCIQTVINKVENLENYMDLQMQFETDGIYDDERIVDITNLQEIDTKKQNQDTSYSLMDLRELNDSGTIEELRYLLEESVYFSSEVEIEPDQTVSESDSMIGYSEQFQLLYNNGLQFETRLPVSGVSLAQYAADHKQLSLKDLYTSLVAASDLLQQYLAASSHVQDNGNFRYFIHNLKTDMVYSNGDWSNDIEAVWAEARQWSLTVRYTKTPEKTTFDTDSTGNPGWLGDMMRDNTLSGDQEEVIIAVDTTYPVADVFQTDSQFYNKYQPVFMLVLILAAISFLAGMICFIIATIQTGRSEKSGPVHLTGFDRIPTEAAGAMIAAVVVLISSFTVTFSYNSSTGYYASYAVITVFILLLCSIIFMWAYLSLVRRIKARTLWQNSLCLAIVDMCKKVYAARLTSRNLIIVFVLFFAGNIFLISTFQLFGVFLVMIIDMLILLYLIKDAAGRQVLREGLGYIAAGDLEYKIDLSTLQGDNLEMAEAVNRVGEGLQKAVEKSMKDERMRAELITNVSHDIKTPLTSIINYVDLLKRENIENPMFENYIRILDMKSQRLKQLTEDLVEASKVSSGNIELHMARIQIQELLQQAYGETEEKFRKKELEIIFNSVEQPAVIWADGRQLWRIYENLLNNIAKYALANTRVYIDLQIIDENAVLTFKNISEQALNISADELTERFTRGDSSRTTEGSGLGLSIAKSLTEMQKGTFEIYLDGDLFKVTLAFELLQEEEQ